jgi:hypothetical protein
MASARHRPTSRRSLFASVTASPGAGWELSRLHLPVGGRRYRPTLEDVIEFLVTEKLAEPRDGWRAVVDAQRCHWETIQLKAAVRRNPQAAAEVLREYRTAA